MTKQNAAAPVEAVIAKYLSQLEIGIGSISAWVDSTKASSPTHAAAGASTTSMDTPTPTPTEQSTWIVRHPSALDEFEQITSAAKGKKVVMFLDYDGTLSPVIDDPDSAFMSDAMRVAVRNVARLFPTAIVSGRRVDKAKPLLFQPAREYLPMIDEVYEPLLERTQSTPGAKVENNKFCVSVHFRCVDDKNWSSLFEQVISVLEDYPKLRITQGRKVLEIRPAIEWDKGKALEFLLESLGVADCKDVMPIYIGDDRTDEDAFKVLRDRGQGFGILVSEFPKETNATYSLQKPCEASAYRLSSEHSP
ncbi:hypothetical protein Cni_G02720 [Canna indica]|uniref:Trehalose 6-phosphate phosphatase n=1 Tax=Canna indica TaxID=4628 RepID=A0AAQ3JRC1_9LILI|nr:hypothetical protein Cni_G02720 [Canna indica]